MTETHGTLQVDSTVESLSFKRWLKSLCSAVSRACLAKCKKNNNHIKDNLILCKEHNQGKRHRMFVFIEAKIAY